MQILFRLPLACLVALFLFRPVMAAPEVLVTIKPVHSLVAAVMKGVAKPTLLIGGAASAHSYSLKPSDARKIAGADIIFEVGPMMESFLDKPLKNLAKGQVVVLARAHGVETLPVRSDAAWGGHDTHGHGAAVDPHIWLSPQNATAMIRAIRDTLKKADPEHAGSYSFNAKMESLRISDMAMSISSKLMLVHRRPYLVFHDAYQYFEAYFDLHPTGAVLASPDRPVSPHRLSQLRSEIKTHKTLCLFREPQFSPALIPTLKADTQIRVDVLDPIGADLAPGPSLYRQLMQNIAGSLAQCLG